MEDKKTGRPTKYKKEYNEQAFKLCLLGATDKEIANFFKVNPDTIYEWKHKHATFSESLRAGKEEADMSVAVSLRDRAMGAKYKKQQAVKLRVPIYSDDGLSILGYNEEIKIVTINGVDVPDTKALEFWLRNRHPDKWNKDKEIADKEDATEVFKKFLTGALGKDNDDRD